MDADDLDAEAELRARVVDLEARLRDLAGVVAEVGAKVLARPITSRAWNWAEFSDEERASALAELRRWMRTILVRYPRTFHQLQPCFAEHPYALDALTAAYGTWLLAMGPKASAELYAYWQDRWRPALERQLSEALSGCRGRHTPDEIDLSKLGDYPGLKMIDLGHT